MRNKPSVVLLCTMLITVFLAAGVFAAADNPAERSYFKLNRAPKYMIPFERPNGAQTLSDKGDANLMLLGTIATSSPGNQAGLTTYDYQHNGTMGRQISFHSANNMVHFVWMAQNNYVIPGDRGIKYQAFESTTSSYKQPAGGKVVTSDYSGYTSCDALDDGTCVFGCHTDPASGVYNSYAYFDFLPGFGLFSDIQICEPDPGASWYLSDMETIWPITNVQYGTERVIYLLTHVFEGSEDMILYRKVGTNPFDNGQYIETVTDLAYTIVSDPNSDNAAIVYTDDRAGLDEGDGSQTDLDVYYKYSTDQGASWGSAINVSNYTGDSLWRAYDDLSAMFTTDGELHIIWAARELRDSTTYENAKSRLIHWSTDVPQSRIISEARYDLGSLCDPGAWNLYIAKMSISECDGKLYSLWTQFGHAREQYGLIDCSQAGFANGELYMAVSDDNGLTWDLPENLTDSRTPACDSSECDSDHWSTMSMYGMVYAGAEDTLDILYINDKDAGGIPQGEGSWCVNPVMHLRVPCRAVVPSPQISLTPNQYVDPTHTAPGVEIDTTLTIINTGNATLTWSGAISYEDGSGWMSITPDNGSVPSGASNTATVDVKLNLGGSITSGPSAWTAHLIITSDAPTSPDTIPVQMIVTTDFDLPQNAVLSTTCKDLMVYSTGRLGGDNSGQSLDIPGDCDTVDQYPVSDMYLYDGTPAIAYLQGSDKATYTSMFTQLFTEDGTFRPQTDLTMAAEAGYNHASFTCSSSDSIFGVDVNLYAPTDGVNCFVVGTYEFYLYKTGPNITGVNLGMIVDWDIPSDSTVDNGSDYEVEGTGAWSTVWQRGAEFHDDNSGVCSISESDRLGGVVWLEGDFKTAWTAENAPFQQGSGMRVDSVYNAMDRTGYFIWNKTDEDSVIDLHSGVVFEKVDMVQGTKYKYAFALITTNEGSADYLDQVAAAYTWYDDNLGSCCITPGDANNDAVVNVGDAVYVINYVFKGGNAPPCLPQADANGDGVVNVGDAVYVINYVFKGGNAPICGPEV